MNRSHILSVCLCVLLASGVSQAAWYSPIVQLVRIFKTPLVHNKKAIAACAVSFAAGILGYMGFDILRDWKIMRKKRQFVEGVLSQVRNPAVSRGYENSTFTDDFIWGKHFMLRVIAHRKGEDAFISVLDEKSYSFNPLVPVNNPLDPVNLI